MRPMLPRRRMLSALTAVVAATSLVPIVPGPAASAADEITCAPAAGVWAIRSNMQLSLHAHNEPETGVESWGAGTSNGSGWPAASWAGPGGRMYYIHGETNTLERHRWLGSGWESDGVSKPIIGDMGYWHDPANAKRFTIDATGAFYLVDQNGELRRRTYDETTMVWDEVIIDGNWGKYDAIFASGEGVLWAREPNGAMFRFRYHAGSQRWLDHARPITGIAWEQYKHLTSPGGDIIYAIRNSDNAIIWYRYYESIGHLTSGTHAGYWWNDSVTAVAMTDACKFTSEPNPPRPSLGTPDRSAKASLLKTTDGNLQYAYVDPEGRAVHAKVTDLYNVGPAGFAALPDNSGFTGTPALAENANGDLRLWAQGVDSDVRGFGQAANGNWNSSINRYGRMLTPPQGVRTSDNRVSYFALSQDGHLWTKFQTHPNGTLYPWRKFTWQPISATKHFTVVAVGNEIHVVALRTSGDYCKLTVVPGSVSDWTCGGQANLGAAAVVAMPENKLQLFARHTDGKIYTTRTLVDGSIPAAWTAMPGELPAGVLAAGDPAALTAPNGTLQVVVRGTDGFTYRTGQKASGSPEWHPWTEVMAYGIENAVDPTVSLAGNTWVIAFRTPAGEPKLLRWEPNPSPNPAAAKTADAGVGTFASVPLGR